MKKAILSILFVAGWNIGVYGQGTVLFQNLIGSGGGLVQLPGPTPYSGPLNLELFYGPVGGTTAQILALNNGTVFLNAPVTAGQFFNGTTVITTGAPGNGSSDATNNVGLVITGWTGSATNLTTAIITGDPAGYTEEFDNPTGGGGVPPAIPANLVNWLADNPLIFLTPEPGTVLLGGLGAVALLLFRRRKQRE
jgi:PEP-CTERM motif